MKIFKYNIFLENKGISKSELVDKIKFYINYIRKYIQDYNEFTSNSLNIFFSYYKLRIIEIFNAVDELNYNSNDSIIRAICNEIIQWGKQFSRIRDSNFVFDYQYVNYTDEYLVENKRRIFNQEVRDNNYKYIGSKIEELISGTKWNIPKITEFNEKDKNIILNCLVNEYDIMDTDIVIKFNERNKGLSIRNKDKTINMDYDTDFIDRLCYYFGGLLIIKEYNNNFLYLPFKN